MTKKQLSDLILLLIGYNDQDRRIDGRVVEALAEQARLSLIAQYAAQYKNVDNPHNILSMFAKSVVLRRQKDPVTGKWFVELPFQLLGFGTTSGIISVGLTQGEEDFVIYNTGMMNVYNALEAGQMDKVQCEIEGNRIVFKNLSAHDEDIMVRAIPSITALKDDEQVPMPAEINYDMIKDVLNNLLQLIRLPEDKINDNRSAI